MFDGIKTLFPIGGNQFLKVGEDKFRKLFRRQKRIGIEAIIRAEAEPVQDSPGAHRFRQRNLHVNHAFRLILQSLRIFEHAADEFHDPVSGGQSVGRVTVREQGVFIAAEFPDPFHTAAIGFHIPTGNSVVKNSRVLITSGGVDIQAGYFIDMKLLFRPAHLLPLRVMALGGMQFAECFHRQKENQFEMWNQAGDRTAFQCGDEFFPFFHKESFCSFENINWYVRIFHGATFSSNF